MQLHVCGQVTGPCERRATDRTLGDTEHLNKETQQNRHLTLTYEIFFFRARIHRNSLNVLRLVRPQSRLAEEQHETLFMRTLDKLSEKKQKTV